RLRNEQAKHPTLRVSRSRRVRDIFYLSLLPTTLRTSAPRVFRDLHTTTCAPRSATRMQSEKGCYFVLFSYGVIVSYFFWFIPPDFHGYGTLDYWYGTTVYIHRLVLFPFAYSMFSLAGYLRYLTV